MSGNDMTDIDEKTLHMLRKAFAMVDKGKSGFIPTAELENILNGFGTTFDFDDLQEAISKVDCENEGKVNFDGFVMIVGTFMEDDNDEAVIDELRQAFRLYDKEGNGYITTKVLREILKELDSKLTDQDLDDIIEDIDEDNKGKIDFEHFKELML